MPSTPVLRAYFITVSTPNLYSIPRTHRPLLRPKCIFQVLLTFEISSLLDSLIIPVSIQSQVLQSYFIGS